MIKRFDDFIKESFNSLTNELKGWDSDPNLTDDENSFLYKFNDLIELLSEEWGSILDICQDNSKKFTFDSTDLLIKKYLKECGLTLEDCINNKDIISIDRYDSINAVVDILLYKIFGDDYNLGNLGPFEDDPEEVFIKYSYGYHKTNYGRILLSQHFGSVDSFLDNIKKKILVYFILDTDAFHNVKYLINELEEELYFTTISDDKVRVYFPLFYDMCYSSIISGLNSFRHDTSYDTFKNFFITWVSQRYLSEGIEEEDEYIDIYL